MANMSQATTALPQTSTHSGTTGPLFLTLVS